MSTLRDNRNIVAASILALGLVAAPSAVSAAMAGSKTVSGSGAVSCGTGWAVSGGGFALPGDTYSSASSTQYRVTSSGPSGQGWQATAAVVRGRYSSTSGWQYSESGHRPRVWAVCVK